MKFGTWNVRSLYRAGCFSSSQGISKIRWVSRKWDVGVWTGSSLLRIGTGGGYL